MPKEFPLGPFHPSRERPQSLSRTNMRWLETTLMRKIALWQVVLCAFASVLGTTMFGATVLHVARGGSVAGPLGRLCVVVAGFPSLVERVLLEGERNGHRVEPRFESPAGFEQSAVLASERREDYILLNRYDGDLGYSVSELVRSNDTTPIARWAFTDPERFHVAPPTQPRRRAITTDPASMRAVHAHLSNDAELTFHFHGSPLYRSTHDGRIRWVNRDFDFHHSIEVDESGDFWVPGHRLDEDGAVVEKPYIDDYVVRIGADGETRFAKSVREILVEHHLDNRIYAFSTYARDPIHLNDIEPVRGNGTLWRVGDVFLSLGHLNLVILFRPATGEVVWWSQDRLIHQHDVNIVDDRSIAVFNNNRRSDGERAVVRGHNEILTFDLVSSRVESPYADTLRTHDIRTVTQGLVDWAEDGAFMVEETNAGRLMMFAPDGRRLWTYINKDSEGVTWTLNWSRVISNDVGDSVARIVEEQRRP